MIINRVPLERACEPRSLELAIELALDGAPVDVWKIIIKCSVGPRDRVSTVNNTGIHGAKSIHPELV